MQITQFIDLTPNGDYERISITNAAVSRLDAAYRENAKGVFITFETSNIRYRIDGGDPDATEGHVVIDRGNLYFRDKKSIKELRMISQDGTGTTAIVTYYK